MNYPDSSNEVRDEVAVAMADAGLVGSARAMVAAPVIKLGIWLMPPELRDAVDGTTLHKAGQEE